MGVIDKLVIRSKVGFDARLLSKISVSKAPAQPMKFYRFNLQYTLPNGAIIFHRFNKAGHELDLKPNHFSCLQAVLDTISFLAPGQNFTSLQVVHRHLNVDLVGYDPNQLKKEIMPRYFRKAYAYSYEVHVKGGKVEKEHYNIDLPNVNFGSKRLRQIAIYSAHRKHPELPNPTTRIENRYQRVWKSNPKDSRRSQPLMNLQEFVETLPSCDPFKHIVFHRLTSTVYKNSALKLKYDHLKLLIEKMGIKLAKQHLRRIDPRYERTFKKILSSLKARKINLNSIFKKEVQKFILAPMSDADQRLLNELKAHIFDH